MNEHQERLHLLIQNNLYWYANIMFQFRQHSYTGNYYDTLLCVEKNLTETIHYMDELLKEVKK